MSGRRILITGVGSSIGCTLASALERDPGVEDVVGIDTRTPPAALERTEIVDADIRNPVISKVVPQAQVDTVVHNQIVRFPSAGMSPRAMHDINVIGTLQLLAACERSDSIRTIVIRGSAGIYGAEPHAPQFFREDLTRLFALRTRFQRDVAEIENYFQTFARRRPGITCSVLRYQPAIGPSLDTQITRYLSLPVVPTYLGFDPRLQFIHESDALGALLAAVRRPVRGAVNVAGPGTIGLVRMVRLAGKPVLPTAPPLFGAVTGAAQRAGLLSFSDDFRRLLRYGRGVDIRRLVDEVGFRPRFSTPEAVTDYLAKQQGRRLVPSLQRAVSPA